MTWYFEERDFAGRWQPRTSPQKPEEAKAEGKRKIRAVRKIEAHFANLTLDQLREIYSPDGKFQNTVANDAT